MKQNKLFNPILNTDIKLINGNSNGIANLTKNKYSWSTKLLDGMNGNFWIPKEISLGSDSNEYKNLTKAEQEAFDKIISFLVFLDSMVTNALPSLSNYITAPEVQVLLTTHAFQEAIHSQSYAYILESVVSAQKRNKIYDLACTDEHMKKRNEYIAGFHQGFIDEPNEKNFLKVVVAQYLLEGIYFQSGFAFFFNLAKNNKLTGVGQEIAYISRDESTHMAIFSNIFKELQKENPELFTPESIEEIYEMARTSTKHEIEWFTYVCGDNIEGLTVGNIDAYIKYLSNQRLKTLGLKILFPEIKTNPFPFIAQMSTPNSVKVDFFENKPINYNKAGEKLALDDLDNVDL
jgi:ribonucleoside-diphosphate reductase beta chain